MNMLMVRALRAPIGPNWPWPAPPGTSIHPLSKGQGAAYQLSPRSPVLAWAVTGVPVLSLISGLVSWVNLRAMLQVLCPRHHHKTDFRLHCNLPPACLWPHPLLTPAGLLEGSRTWSCQALSVNLITSPCLRPPCSVSTGLCLISEGTDYVGSPSPAHLCSSWCSQPLLHHDAQCGMKPFSSKCNPRSQL